MIARYRTAKGDFADIRSKFNGYLHGHVLAAKGLTIFHWTLSGEAVSGGSEFNLTEYISGEHLNLANGEEK